MKVIYWLKIWFFVFFFLLIGAFVLIIYLNKFENVPLRFTNSISFDAKLNFLKKSEKWNNVEIIIIGSSMGLNNINSGILSYEFQNENIVNISSWGLKVQEVFDLLKLINLSKVKKIIYLNQYFDFYGESINDYNKEHVKKYLNNKFDLSPYLKTFNTLNYDFKDYILWKKRYINNNYYNDLGFNEYGDVELFIPKHNINLKRWNEIVNTENLKNNFDSFENMIKFLNKNKIELIVVTTPYRKEFFSIDKFINQYNAYSMKILELNKQYDFKYINLQNSLELSDTFFVDSSHLSSKGAELVSKKIVEIIKKD